MFSHVTLSFYCSNPIWFINNFNSVINRETFFPFDFHENMTSDESVDKSILLANPLHEIALTSAILGSLFGISISAFFILNFKSPSIYIMALSVFHFLEYYVTAKYNLNKVHKESFIINNGSSYTIAHSFALIEVGIEYYFFPQFKRSYSYIKLIGLVLIIFGQYIRYLSMKTAGKSFSHLVKSKKEDDHVLITSGIYSILRHPSYFGFFYWAIGTQLLLLNPISLIGFSYVLWLFFSQRIEYEEKYLIQFFGLEYIDYKARTKVYIPFIN